MKLYGLKNCDSCKKALKEIRDAGKQIEFIDIRNSPISFDTMQDWLDQHGDAMLINRKSTTWRNLNDADRQMPAPILLEAHPTLIKRPIIVAGEHSFIGWNKNVKAVLGIE